MTTQPIIESGMTFGPFPHGHCFHIEKSEVYRKVKVGVKMVEFLLLKIRDGHPPIVWMVEARSSTPKPQPQPNFDAFIDEMRQKFTNALSLGLAACLKRHEDADAELPEPFKGLDLSVTSFRLILVINHHKDAWCDPLRDALEKALRSTVKTWALGPAAVLVINDGMARSHGLILPNVLAT
jgi:hypothetical protein